MACLSDLNGRITINVVSFEVDRISKTFLWSEVASPSNVVASDSSIFADVAALAINSLSDESTRADIIRDAVGWFKSEDLPLLYKVLDDPQSFGITSIKPGYYVLDVLTVDERYHYVCIVGALAVAKADSGAKQLEIEYLAGRMVDEGDILLGVLDQIIADGHLDAFKAEIYRQMAER